jgi:hypothetical protein
MSLRLPSLDDNLTEAQVTASTNCGSAVAAVTAHTEVGLITPAEPKWYETETQEHPVTRDAKSGKSGKLSCNKFYYKNVNSLKSYDAVGDCFRIETEKIVSVDSVYDLLNYYDKTSETFRFVVFVFSVVVAAQVYLLAAITPGCALHYTTGNSGSFWVCLLVFVAFSLSQFSWTTKKVYFALCALVSRWCCHNSDDMLVTSSGSDRFVTFIVVLTDLFLWGFMTYRSVQMMITSESVSDRIVNLLSIGFILSLDEVTATLMHRKVVLTVRLNERDNLAKIDSKPGLTDRRKFRFYCVVLAYFIGVAVAACIFVYVYASCRSHQHKTSHKTLSPTTSPISPALLF